MKYETLEHELEENLDKLERMCSKWEVSESEVERYKQYMKRTLYCYKVIEWRNLQQQMLKSSEQEWK